MRWAILGAGNIAKKFAENIMQVENSKIVSVASKSINKLKDFSKNYNIEKNNCYSNYQDILKSDFDIAYVGLINNLHEETISFLSKNKKNILSEKPAFLNIDSFKKNIELIKKQKIFFMESMMYLHHPQTKKVFEIIRNNEIGEIYKFEYNLGFDIRKKFLNIFKKKINFLSRLTDPQLGGGAINDIGCYPISFANKLANFYSESKVKELFCYGKIGLTNVDEFAKAKITYNNSFKAEVAVSINKKLDCLAIIYGTKGKLVVPNLITPQKSYSIIVKTKKENKYNFFGDDLYTYIIKDTQSYILNKVCEPNKNGLNWSEMQKNIEILDSWKAQVFK